MREDQYYAPYVKWASETGIVLGVGGDRFAPTSAVTRERVALLFSRYAEATGATLPQTEPQRDFADLANVGEHAREVIEQLSRAGIINGKNETTFDPKGTAKRSEMAAMIHRFVLTAASY